MAPYNFADSIGSMFSSLTPSSKPAVPNVGGSSPSGFNASSFLDSMAPKTPASPFIPNGNMASPMQTPTIPSVSALISAPAKKQTGNGLSYAVQPGDTLDGIAESHGTTVNALLAANPTITNPNFIEAGNNINIPAGNTPVVPGTTPANISASNTNPSLSGHPAIPTTDGSGTVNSNTGSYTPIVSADNGNGSSPTTSIYGGATSGLLSNNSTNSATTGPGVEGYDAAVGNLSQFEQGLQGTLGDIGRQAIPMPFIQGQQQVTNTENAGVLSALQGAVNQAQTGIGLGIQGAQTQNTGLQEAGSLTAPVAGASYFGTPETGDVIGNNFPQAMQQYAQMAANGQYSAIPSSITSNPILSAQLNAAATALNPNYSPVTSAAESNATASNVSTAGTAETSAANTGYQQSVQDYASMTAMNGQASTQAKQVQNVLSTLGLNEGVPDYNSAVNTLSNKLGGTGYTQLVTAMTELQNMYSQFLSVGGTTPTGSENQALSLLNPNSSASQINASIGQLNTAMYNRMSAQYSKMNTFSTNLGTNSSNAPAGSENAVDNNNPFSSSNFFGQ